MGEGKDIPAGTEASAPLPALPQGIPVLPGHMSREEELRQNTLRYDLDCIRRNGPAVIAQLNAVKVPACAHVFESHQCVYCRVWYHDATLAE